MKHVMGGILSVVCVVMGGIVSAEEVRWKSPSADHAGDVGEGIYDIANGANWANGAVPLAPNVPESAAGLTDELYQQAGATPIARFYAAGSAKFTVTATTDVALRQLYFGNSIAEGGNYDVTFDLGDHTIDLWGEKSSSAVFFAHDGSGRNQTFTLKSGTIQRKSVIPESKTVGSTAYEFGSQYRMTPNGSKSNVKMFIDGPTSRLIVPQLNFGGSVGNLFCITNGGYVKASRFYLETKGGTGGVFKVTGSGSVFETDASITSTAYDNSPSETYNSAAILLHVTDNGMITNFCGNFGNRGHNIHGLVDKGGVFHVGGWLAIGSRTNAYPTNNLLEVTDGGRLVLGGKNQTLWVGSAGMRNRLFVHDRGEAYLSRLNLVQINTRDSFAEMASNEILIGAGGRVVVSNGITIGYNQFGNASIGTNNIIRVSGENARLELLPSGSLPDAAISIRGSRNGIEIDNYGFVTNCSENNGLSIHSDCFVHVKDHGQLKMKKWIHVGEGLSSNALFKVEDFGEVVTADMLQLGATSQTNYVGDTYGGVAYNNTVFVGANASLTCGFPVFYGYGNNLIISNGTFTSMSTGWAFMTTRDNREDWGGDTTITFLGEKPRLVAHKYMIFYADAKVNFVIPKEGITGGAVVTAVNESITVHADCTLNVDATACKKGGTFTLMDAGTAKVTVDANVLAAANERIKGLGRLYLGEGNHTLMLKVFNQGGTVLFIR